MSEHQTSETPPPQTDVAADRRRPGRVDFDNPHLIDLLRRPDPADANAVPPQTLEEELTHLAADHDGDPLRAARGLVTGVLISIALWASAILTWKLLF